MDFNKGDVVRTPEGETGRIAAPSTGARFDYYELSAREINIAVYTVLLDSGKVERWTHAALEEANGEIRRSGSLQ